MEYYWIEFFLAFWIFCIILFWPTKSDEKSNNLMGFLLYITRCFSLSRPPFLSLPHHQLSLSVSPSESFFFTFSHTKNSFAYGKVLVFCIASVEKSFRTLWHKFIFENTKCKKVKKECSISGTKGWWFVAFSKWSQPESTTLKNNQTKMFLKNGCPLKREKWFLLWVSSHWNGEKI